MKEIMGRVTMTTESSINTCATVHNHAPANQILNAILTIASYSRQHAVVSIQLNIVACPTYPEKNHTGQYYLTLSTTFRCHCHCAFSQPPTVYRRKHVMHESRYFDSCLITADSAKVEHCTFFETMLLLSNEIITFSPLNSESAEWFSWLIFLRHNV